MYLKPSIVDFDFVPEWFQCTEKCIFIPKDLKSGEISDLNFSKNGKMYVALEVLGSG